MQVEQITDPIAYHGEGPVWAAQWGGLHWVDMLNGDVLSLAADGTVTRQHVATVVAALRPRQGGGAVQGAATPSRYAAQRGTCVGRLACPIAQCLFRSIPVGFVCCRA